MASTPTTDNFLKTKLERVLIALPFITIVVFYIIGDTKELKETNAIYMVYAFEIVLAIYYTFILRNLYCLLFLGLISYNISAWFGFTSIQEPLLMAGKVTYFIMGLWLGYKTIQESIQNKDLELFGTILTLAYLFPLIHHFVFPENEEFIMVFYFSLAFVLSTVMYSENLWDKYNTSEKKLLTFTLIATIVEVLFISIKLI